MLIEKSDNSIKIHNSNIFLMLSIGCVVMTIAGILLLINIFPDGHFEAGDILGVIFLSLWTCVAFGMGLFSFINLSKVLILKEKGITCRSIVKKDFIDWSEIKDWGLSYCGLTRGVGNTYYLYFSQVLLKTKSKERKILKGTKIKINVLEGEYPEIANKIIPYCKEYIQASPFVSSRILA